MNFQLHLVPAPTAAPAAAGWLPDANARSGLEEVRRLVESGAATADAVRIYTVSRPGSRLALGLVIVPPASGKPLADIFSSRVQLLGWCGPNVAAPVHSRLNGGLSNAEFSRYFPYHFQFFHPSGGIWAFEPQDALRPEDLLALPTILEQDWSLARPGLPPVPLLVGLGVAQEQSLDALMQSMADGIGADADKPESQSLLGKTGEKIGDALGLAGNVGMGILGGLMSGLFKVIPGGMAGQNLEKLRQLAAQNLQVLQNLRNRELDKLINLLEKNPEEGLRRALPLAGNGNDGGRGRGRTTAQWVMKTEVTAKSAKIRTKRQAQNLTFPRGVAGT